VLLIHHTVRGTRGILTLPVTIPRNEGKFAIPPPYGYPSPERGVASKVPFLTISRKIWIEPSLLYRRLGLYEAWEGEPSGLRQYVTMSLADSYLREWNHTNGN
jgi:hypothetical protein